MKLIEVVMVVVALLEGKWLVGGVGVDMGDWVSIPKACISS